MPFSGCCFLKAPKVFTRYRNKTSRHGQLNKRNVAQEHTRIPSGPKSIFVSLFMSDVLATPLLMRKIQGAMGISLGHV